MEDVVISIWDICLIFVITYIQNHVQTNLRYLIIPTTPGGGGPTNDVSTLGRIPHDRRVLLWNGCRGGVLGTLLPQILTSFIGYILVSELPGIPRNPFLLQSPICNCNCRWWTLREASPSPETTTISKKRDKDGTEGLSLIQKLHFNQMSSILRYYGVMHFIASSHFQHWKGKQLPDNQRCRSMNFFVFVCFWLAASHFPFWYWILGGQVRK